MIFLLLLFSALSWGVTEEDVARSVIKNFPLVEEALLKAKASDEEVNSASGAFDHKLKFKSRNQIEDQYDNQYFETYIERLTPFRGITLKAGHRQGSGTFAEYDGELRTSAAGEIFAGFMVPLLQGFKTDLYRTNLQISKIEAVIASANLELKQYTSVHKALSLYYKFLFLNQKLKIHEEVLKIAKDRQEILRKKFKAGDIERLKLLDNERSIDKRKDEIAKTRIQLEDVKTELSLYYRDENGKPIIVGQSILPGENHFPSVPMKLNTGSLPQIKILKNSLEAGELSRKFLDQTKLPSLNLEVIGAKELSQDEPYDPENLKIGISFTFPLENRKASGKTVATEYKNLAMKKELLFITQNLQRQLDFTSEAMKLTQERWRIISSELGKTQKLAEAERSRWLQGASDLYIVTLREQDAAETNIRRWYAWLEYQRFALDSKLYSGTILPEI